MTELESLRSQAARWLKQVEYHDKECNEAARLLRLATDEWVHSNQEYRRVLAEIHRLEQGENI